jgi:hypothetical protein
MKIRTSFVSNSSSASFVIINASLGYESFDDKFLADDIVFGRLGETEFGWGTYVVRDIYSRINFAYLQTQYAEKHLDMLEEVIREHIGSDVPITWDMSIDSCADNWAHIDHQSSAVEDENMEIFDSEENLKDFLFGKGSYIQLDNDNY